MSKVDALTLVHLNRLDSVVPRGRAASRGSVGRRPPTTPSDPLMSPTAFGGTPSEHIREESTMQGVIRFVCQLACLALAMAVAMADSTSSTVTSSALAKGLSACLAGTRLVPPDSHLMYVGADICARAARFRALSPADVRRRRRSGGPPASRRSSTSTFSAWARRRSISGRGAELPSSQREILSPPATSIRRANSCWVRPIRRRASRRATGSTPDSARTDNTLRRQGGRADGRQPRRATGAARPELLCGARTVAGVDHRRHAAVGSPYGDASVDSRIVHQKRSFRCRELMLSLNSAVDRSTPHLQCSN